MLDIKDSINLLTGVNLGVLAAALTLIALYPAVIGFIRNIEVSTMLKNEKQRLSLFRWLVTTACASWLGLTLILVFAVLGGVRNYISTDSEYFQIVDNTSNYIFKISVFATAMSLLAIARGGWVIVKMTLKVL